jgi:hypothetical protein
MRFGRVTLLAVAPLMASCGLAMQSATDVGPVNACTSAGECGADATCVQATCVATKYDLQGILVTVQIPPNATFGAGMAWVVDPGLRNVQLVSQGAADTAFAQTFDVQLAKPVSIRGAKVVLDPSTVAPGCSAPDSSVPANVTFFRVPHFAGFPFQPVQTVTQGSTSYSFDLDLVSDPDDLYDVYIEPQPPAGCMISIPPYFMAGQTIDKSRTLWPLPPIGTLSGTIAGLRPSDGWQLDLVEPDRGLPISAGSVLAPSLAQTGAIVSAQVSTIDPSHWPILRLTPIDPITQAADTTRPTVYWSLQGAISGGTTSSPVVTLQNDVTTDAVNVQGQILGADGTGTAATLTIQSQTLQNMDVGGNASFSIGLLPTGQIPGQFTVPLPPGNYWIRAVPTADESLSVTDNMLAWPAIPGNASCVCGKTFQLAKKAPFAGTISTPSGAPLVATNLQVSPSQDVPRSYLAQTHALGALPARIQSGSTDERGGFGMLLDLGVSDVTVKTDPSTKFPWLVRPRVTPAPGMAPLQLALTSPAFLSGTVVDPSGNPVANAEIDAWFEVRDPAVPSGLTGTVVQIATASTDANGAYTLILPSSL